jgi:hypothetical protein
MMTISAIVLSIILHAQTVMPVLGSTQAPTAAPTVTNYRPLVLEVGKPLVLRVGTPVVLR